jgi:hypothetical protein
MLFAIVGVSFVFYAGSCELSERAYLESVGESRPDVDPEQLFCYFMGQLLYDAADDQSGVYSGLRGQSLSRNMFGMNYMIESDGRIKRNNAGQLVDAAGNVLNDVPFNGTGRQHYDPQLPFPVLPPNGNPAKDDFNLINYTYFPADIFLRDPERRGWRTGLRPAGQPDQRKAFVGGFNAPYTYPDLNNMFLAAVKADGTVLMPSFHRPWTGFGPLGPNNWRWTSDVDPNLSPGDPLYGKPQPWLKYMVLRPRPIDMGPGFPLPDDAGGDVKNLIGAPGSNDSIWLDLDFPVLQAPDGRKYKPLFAPLIVDLDNRVNLNVHGNLRGVNSAAHASHQGWGPWEVNPEQLDPLPSITDPGYVGAVLRRLEWANVLHGTATGDRGRYGQNSAPHSNLVRNEAPGPLTRFYAPADFDGSRELATGIPRAVGRPSARMHLPGTASTPPFVCFPTFPARSGYGNDSAAERAGHPLLYNPFRPYAPDRALGLSGMEALLRYGDTGSQALTSELWGLCPRNFVDDTDRQGAARRRRLVTLASFDPDRPGVTPWFWSTSADDAAYYRLPPREPIPTLSPYVPSGGAVPPPPEPLSTFFESEFGPDGRTAAALTAVRRLDLNRYLPDYPSPDATTGRITDIAGFAVAEKARQIMAAEIFDVLWRVTGAGNPAVTPAPDAPGHDAARWDALRWLAQLAVNVVDYIDNDDYLTPFNWYNDAKTGRQEWVYGTELPRVVLNEVYVEYGNDPADPGVNRGFPQATRLKGNVWVELFNPFQDDPPLTAPYRKGAAQLEMRQVGNQAAYGIYRLILAKLNTDLRQPDNVRGEVAAPDIALNALSSFTPEANFEPAPGVDTRYIMPVDLTNTGGFASKVGENRGFYVLGPSLSPGEPSPFAASGQIETVRRHEMSYVVRATYPALLLKPSLLLQRLACPHLPPQPNPAAPLYNPYITVDFVREVTPNYAAVVGVDGPNAPLPQPIAERSSMGRRQPYAAHASQLKPQRPNPARVNEPQHTFFQHNADSNTPGPNWRVAPQNYPPFDWLVHLDRELISPMELLHVSGFKPHELTQQFRTGDTTHQRFAHRTPWLDEDLAEPGTPQSHRLYRALEFLGTHSRILGMMTAVTTSPSGFPPNVSFANQLVTPKAMSGSTANGGTWRIEAGCSLVIDRGQPSEEVVRVKAVGPAPNPTWFVADFLKRHGPNFTITPTTVSERVPGRINLNTVWDEETFLALCDANSSNVFNEGVVKKVFQHLKASRTVSGDAPGPNDRPFQSLASGLSPTGYSKGWLQDTVLRFEDPNSPARLPIVAVPGQTHPYQTFELLTKVANNVTVRSNVFAVWVTVGFFEVDPGDPNASPPRPPGDSFRPVKLGAELGSSEGRQIRHRMFAIVDRSVMTANPGPQPRFDPRGPLPRVVPYFSIID